MFFSFQTNSETIATFSLPAGLSYPVQIPAGVTLQTASGTQQNVPVIGINMFYFFVLISDIFLPFCVTEVNFTRSTFLLWSLRLQQVSLLYPEPCRECLWGGKLLPPSHMLSHQKPLGLRGWIHPLFQLLLFNCRHIHRLISPLVRRRVSPSHLKFLLLSHRSFKGSALQSQTSTWKKMSRVHNANL